MDFNVIKIDRKKITKQIYDPIIIKKKHSNLILNTNENIWFLGVYIVNILHILHAIFYKLINLKDDPSE